MKIDETRKFCEKFDKITETSDEIFEKFVWNIRYNIICEIFRWDSLESFESEICKKNLKKILNFKKVSG